MKKVLFVLFAAVFALAFVFASAGNASAKRISELGTDIENDSVQGANHGPVLGLGNGSLKEANRTKIGFGAANMTFGKCVSGAAKVRNECYKNAAEQTRTCASGENKNRSELKQCKTAAKDSANQCKKAFKDEKKNTCGKIKASFMEKVRAAFM